MFRHFFILALLLFPFLVSGQEQGIFSGNLQSNVNFYQDDSIRGTETTQYFHEKSSVDGWLFLNYRLQGWNASVRFDMFNHSPLMNPQEAFTRQGIGYYNLTRRFGKMEISGGYFYDQFGSGVLFRAFEDRNLGLDYAIQGINIKLYPTDRLMIKGFAGLQKFRFDHHQQPIKGANAEYIWDFAKGNVQMLSGAGVVNRTLDRGTMLDLAGEINSKPVGERFVPMYNVYAGSVYNTLAVGNLSLYTEYARKSREAVYVFSPESGLNLHNSDGSLAHVSLNYSFPKYNLGINLQYRLINMFVMRTSPYTNLLVGLVNYLPPLSRQQALRLPARYSIAAQPQGEEGLQGEITWSPNRHTTFVFNASDIKALDGQHLFREYYLDMNRRINPRLSIDVGLQSVHYNQEVYEQKPQVPNVMTITPFAEFYYRLGRNVQSSEADTVRRTGLRALFSQLRPSLRGELQYLRTGPDHDLGDFAWALLELNLAPRFSFSVSDMVNTRPTKGDEIIHYYTVFASYTREQTRITAGYIKQVQGVVCTGGVCRVEPAFSGVRLGLFTNF